MKGERQGKCGKCLLASTQRPKWPAAMSIWPAKHHVHDVVEVLLYHSVGGG